ncbi:hypothetical protein EI94DRAFT_1731053, partial [Lactarius quietus]
MATFSVAFVTFFTLASAGRTTNTIRWSSRGRHVVLATVGSTSKSELEFWDLDFNSDDVVKKDPPKEKWGTGIQQLGTADHVEWDPSGRYLVTGRIPSRTGTRYGISEDRKSRKGSWTASTSSYGVQVCPPSLL